MKLKQNFKKSKGPKMDENTQLQITNKMVTTSELCLSGTTTEHWKRISGWPYEVSDLGNIRPINPSVRHPRSRLGLKGGIIKIKKCRYRIITLTRQLPGQAKEHKCFSWHKLVANAWLGPCPEGLEIDHKDGNGLNNAVSNLHYLTPSENIEGSVRRGHRGTNRWNAKHTESQVREVKMMYLDGYTKPEIAKTTGLSMSFICHVLAGRQWKHVA